MGATVLDYDFGYRPFWTAIFMIFIIPSRQMLGWLLKVGFDLSLAHSLLQLIHNDTLALNYETYWLYKSSLRRLRNDQAI